MDASEVTDLHVVSYEVERDLIPLILSNCQYQVEQGGETSQEFDLEKIQRQISSRFLQGKPLLTLKVGGPSADHVLVRREEPLWASGRTGSRLRRLLPTGGLWPLRLLWAGRYPHHHLHLSPRASSSLSRRGFHYS